MLVWRDLLSQLKTQRELVHRVDALSQEAGLDALTPDPT